MRTATCPSDMYEGINRMRGCEKGTNDVFVPWMGCDRCGAVIPNSMIIMAYFIADHHDLKVQQEVHDTITTNNNNK